MTGLVGSSALAASGGLSLLVFEVGHGLCVFGRAPNAMTFMIDCGASDDFSPTRYLTDRGWVQRPYGSVRPLEALVITHPHVDHLSDIRLVSQWLQPTVLVRNKGFDWSELEAQCGAHTKASDILSSYSHWQDTYRYALPPPDWGGVALRTRGLDSSEARGISEASYINNTSIVASITYAGTRVVVGGDLETQGWVALLENEDFVDMVAGASFFVVPHHGHVSGFCGELFDVMGRPLLNILSVRSLDDSVDPRYFDERYVQGINFGGKPRRTLTTRLDGTIGIHVDPSGGAHVTAAHLPPNMT